MYLNYTLRLSVSELLSGSASGIVGESTLCIGISAVRSNSGCEGPHGGQQEQAIGKLGEGVVLLVLVLLLIQTTEAL